MDTNKTLWNNINKLTDENRALDEKLKAVTRSYEACIHQKDALAREVETYKSKPTVDVNRVRALETDLANARASAESAKRDVNYWRDQYNIAAEQKVGLANKVNALNAEVTILRNAPKAPAVSSAEKTLWDVINKQKADLAEVSTKLVGAQRGARRNRIAAFLMALAGVLTAGTAAVKVSKGALPWKSDAQVVTVATGVDEAASDEAAWQK